MNIFWGALVLCFSFGFYVFLIVLRNRVWLAWSLEELEVPVKNSKDFIVLFMVGEGGTHREVFGKCPSLANRNGDVMGSISKGVIQISC